MKKRGWSDSDTDAYEKSNSVEDTGATCPEGIVKEYLECDGSDPEERRRRGQTLLNALAISIRLPTVPLKVLDKPMTDRKGDYEYWDGFGRKIRLWNRTRKTAKPVGAKTTLETLCHEFCHHADITGLKLKKSYHTLGFAKRTQNLYKRLVMAGETNF